MTPNEGEHCEGTEHTPHPESLHALLVLMTVLQGVEVKATSGEDDQLSTESD